MFRNGFVFRLIGVLLLIGLMIGGGFMAYRAGIAQGIAQAPEVASAISQAAENGQVAPIIPPVYGYGYGGGSYPYHHFGFFPIGGIFASILFLSFFLGLMRMIFFRPWRMGWGHHGPWEHGPYGHPWGGPPWMRPQGEEGEKKEESPEEKK